MGYDRTFSELSTTDLHLASGALTKLIGVHDLRTIGPPEWLDLDVRAVDCFGITSVALGCGSAFRLELPGSRRDYVVIRVLMGECRVDRDGEPFRLGGGDLVVVAPDQKLALRPAAGCALRMVKIRQLLMHQNCARLVGFPPTGPIRFSSMEHRRPREWETWSQRLEQLLVSLEDGPRLLPRGYWRAIEDLFVEQLLRYPWHEYHGLLRRSVRPFTLQVRPKAMEAAEFVAVLIRIAPVKRRSAAEYARFSGMASRRELSKSFRWLWGVSIEEFRRGVLLDCVHTELLDGEPEYVTVAQVFRRWGLPRTARSHRQYRRRFREWPCETLRQSSGHH